MGIKALNNSQPVRRCKHVNARGNVCHRPAIRGCGHCYIHLEDLSVQLSDDYFKTDLELPVIDGLASIQVAESKVLAAFSAGDITRRQATLCFYALQIARQAAKQLEKIEKNRKTEKRAELLRPFIACTVADPAINAGENPRR